MDNNIWFSNINLLFNKDNLFNIIPSKSMSNGEKINSITRFSLYLSVLLYVASGNYLYFYIFLGTMVSTYLIYIFNETEFFINSIDNQFKKILEYEENNSNLIGDNSNNSNNNNNSNDTSCKKPTKENPLMNPLLGDNPYENNGACEIDNKILDNIDKKFCEKLFLNTSSIFNNRNNQRAFYTVPNSNSVNDQSAFAKWLYNTPVSCESGNSGLLKQRRACAFNSKTLDEIKNEL
jgi:hypothetical protein